MATLTQKTLHFNRKIKLSNDGGSLSPQIQANFYFGNSMKKLVFPKLWPST